MGDEAVGIVSAGWYSAALETPSNKQFVENLRKVTGVDPGFYSVGAYSAGLAIEAALTSIDGGVDNKDAFFKALRNVAIANDPRGPWKLDKYGNPVENIYIRKVERKDGKLVNTVIKTYDQVSQFWNYPPEQFLGAPVYSRNDPTQI
jgi:branched-chain amino acid transport system substrate-binding protein